MLCIDNFDKCKNTTYNISSGIGYSIYDIAKEIIKINNSKSNINIKKSRTGEVRRFIANIEKIRKVVGYIPKYDIHDGLKLSISWFNNL